MISTQLKLCLFYSSLIFLFSLFFKVESKLQSEPAWIHHQQRNRRSQINIFRICFNVLFLFLSIKMHRIIFCWCLSTLYFLVFAASCFCLDCSFVDWFLLVVSAWLSLVFAGLFGACYCLILRLLGCCSILLLVMFSLTFYLADTFKIVFTLSFNINSENWALSYTKMKYIQLLKAFFGIT